MIRTPPLKHLFIAAKGVLQRLRGSLPARLGAAATLALALAGCASTGGAPATPGGPAANGAGSAAQAQPAAPAQIARGPLYTFSKDGKTHSLYGTLHVGRPDWTQDAALQAALARASALAVEVDVSQALPIQLALQRYAVASDAQTAAAGLPADLVERLRAGARQAGLSAGQARVMKPWFLANQLSISAFARGGYVATAGSEVFLMGAAKQRRLPIVELESVEQQFAMLDAMPGNVLREYVEQALQYAQGSSMPADLQQLVRAWEQGDLKALAAMVNTDPATARASDRWLNEELLLSRHPQMVERIVALAGKEPSVMVAVGALHLPGERGLIALLRKAGFEVRRVERPGQVASGG
ncbi:TraB/GumN family protein [Piscinibacterium candidicorallinum]|uniref:TraB/GumN family protein n=1 Tax=Piscinibacterium candidicorallinum TaxID=1793872 RepID=A0ABV7H8K4_9BURK